MDKEQFLIMHKDDLEFFARTLADIIAPQEKDRFIPEHEARKILCCGKTQLLYYRNSGKIDFFQDPDHPKKILYDRESIEKYLTNSTNLHRSF